MTRDFEHFGMPAENIQAAQKWAQQHRKKYLYHTHVPSRKEVLTLPVDELSRVLVGWMVHSPIEIVPSKVQVEQVMELLEQRDDVEELKRLLEMCRHYVSS